jgi:hypothetical protein
LTAAIIDRCNAVDLAWAVTIRINNQCIHKHRFNRRDAKKTFTDNTQQLCAPCAVAPSFFCVWPQIVEASCRVNSVVTVDRMDAVVERTGTYSQRVTKGFARHEAVSTYEAKSVLVSVNRANAEY